MPGPLRAFAEYQPVTLIVNSMRDLSQDLLTGCACMHTTFHLPDAMRATGNNHRSPAELALGHGLENSGPTPPLVQH